MNAITRFAPSPTGLLHVGGARTALFNWAYARHGGGRFLLRIEDTDQERSTAENEQAIIQALDWLGLNPDGEIVRQSERADLYRQKAEELLAADKAYRCYATAEELDELRASQEKIGEKPRYDRRWRERRDYPDGKDYCIRFATDLDGETELDDLIRGSVKMANAELDDLVILRSDGSATYNFAAVVDDIDMGITHVIRGEDHLTNTIRQIQMHRGFGRSGKELPQFAHLPLILGRKLGDDGNPAVKPDGSAVYERLSKRNQATDIDHYRQEGYPAEAMCNYLAQLGWTQPGDEIYLLDELALEFEISRVNRSAARFDLDRLRWISQQHLRRLDPATLAKHTGRDASSKAFALGCEKAHTLNELRDELSWCKRPSVTEDLKGQLRDDNRQAFSFLCQSLAKAKEFDPDSIKKLMRQIAGDHDLGFARLGMPLRVALTGGEKSADIAEIASLLGKGEVDQRLAAWLDC